MTSIFEQIITLLVQPSGSMVYHLVVAFIFISVLQPALSFIPTGERSQRNRLLIGVLLLIASRLILFAISLLTIWGSLFLTNALPVIELAVTAFDFAIIIWLFAFNQPNRPGDIGLILFGLAILVGGTISTIYWGIQNGAESFNQSGLALIWEIGTLVILLIGIVTLVMSKTPARFQGIVMAGMLLIGEAAQIFIKPTAGDYFPISRLSHLVAFPLLVGILQNYQAGLVAPAPAADEQIEEEEEAETTEEETPEPEETEFDKLIAQEDADLGETPQTKENGKALEAHIYQNGVAMAGTQDAHELCRLFTRYTSYALLADLCLLLTPPDNNKQVHLICGYDLIVQESLEGTSFSEDLIPRYQKMIETGRPIHILDQGTERMEKFADILQVEEVHNLLAYPVLNDELDVVAVIVLISPYSKRLWTADDQEFLKDAIEPIQKLLVKATAPVENQRSLVDLTEKLEFSNTDRHRLEEENLALSQKIEELSQKADTQPEEAPVDVDEYLVKIHSLEAALAILEEEKKELIHAIAQQNEKNKILAEAHAQLLDENQELSQTMGTPDEIKANIDALTNANESLVTQNVTLTEREEQLSAEIEQLTGELESLQNKHQSDLQTLEGQLQETQSSLQTINDFQAYIDDNDSQEQNEVIASIAQEIRQPMSSISGYTDLLISESVGILGALQKKFLERVKVSTDRMNQLLNDLIHITTMDTGKFIFTLQPMDLMDAIDTAIDSTSAQFREKEISLRVDIDTNLPKLHTDKDALQQIMIHLLQNAGTTSNADGEVILKAHMYDNANDDVILLSVTDSGDGIPKEDLPRVFSRLYRADNPLIQGVGDTGVGLSIAKTLTEALGGRIWVESESGKGSTFSVLLPITSPNAVQQEDLTLE